MQEKSKKREAEKEKEGDKHGQELRDNRQCPEVEQESWVDESWAKDVVGKKRNVRDAQERESIVVVFVFGLDF